jgi:MFS family permease
VVIAVHIAAMYLPSPVTGWLADRYGRRPVLFGAGVVLALAGLSGALSDPESVVLASLTLGLLGLGWNLGLIGGTALITDATGVHERARTQGAVDLTIALAGASGGLASGVIVASASFTLLSVLGGIAGLLILPAVLAGSSRR